MARRDDDFGLLLAGGLLLGFGLIAAAQTKESNEARRARFEARVREAVEAKVRAKLTALTLGRGKENRPLWDVTLLANGAVWTVRVPLQVGAEPYGDEAIEQIVETLARRLEERLA